MELLCVRPNDNDSSLAVFTWAVRFLWLLERRIKDVKNSVKEAVAGRGTCDSQSHFLWGMPAMADVHVYEGEDENRKQLKVGVAEQVRIKYSMEYQ